MSVWFRLGRESMGPLETYQVTLYVRSTKKLTHTEVVSERGLISGKPKVENRPDLPPDYSPVYTPKVVPMHEYIIPDDQKKMIDTVEAIAKRFGIGLRVVDVTRENFLERVIQEHIKGIAVFPTLENDSGRRIEGKMSSEQIVSFLSPLKKKEKDFL